MSATKHDNPGLGGAYRLPPEPKRWPSIGLAVGVHALLLAFLWVGVSWQNNAPVAVEAEVWDMSVQSAAPPPPPPQEAEPEPEPEPVKPPTPREIAPPPVVAPPVPKLPDIALERETKRKEELKRKKEEQLEREQERERELAKQEAADKKAKALQKKEQAKKEEAEKRELAKQEEADKKKKEKADKEKADKLAKAKAEKAEEAKLAKLRDADMQRLITGAGTSGSAAKSTGPRSDKAYEAAIQAKVKGNTSYGGDDAGNPTVTFIVNQLPTGEIISVKKTRSSGVPAFDDAVEKGINKSSPLPKKKDGTVERTLEINFRMKDMQ